MKIHLMTRSLFVGLLVAVAALRVGGAMAQAYPCKPITVVAPFPPGGPNDSRVRMRQDPGSHCTVTSGRGREQARSWAP